MTRRLLCPGASSRSRSIQNWPQQSTPNRRPLIAIGPLELLRRVIAKGHEDVERIKRDKNLDPLRGQPEFQQLLSDLETKAKPKSP